MAFGLLLGWLRADDGLGLAQVLSEAAALELAHPRDHARVAPARRELGQQPEVPLYAEWKRLVSAYGVSGKEAHDARLVAATLTGGLSHILTFNGKDFARYVAPAPQGEGITLVDPSSIVAAGPPTAP